MCSPAISAPRLRKKSRPLRPISSSFTAAPRMLRREALRALDQVGVEGARQALVAGDQHQQDAPFLGRRASSGFGRRASSAAAAAATLRQHLPQQRAVGPRRDHAVLRAAQLGRRDHLHGLGDLLRVLDRADAPPDVDQARHVRVCRCGCSATKRALNSSITRRHLARAGRRPAPSWCGSLPHRPRCALSTKRYSSSSNLRHCSTGRSSR